MNNLVEIREKIKVIYKKSGLYFSNKEFENMEITDFGLCDFNNIGLSLIIYINTDRVCAKELALFPYQICPQHKHPDINNSMGKEETFRCRWGKAYLYIEGPGEINNINVRIPNKYRKRFNVFYEIILKPGDQYTLKPNTWHWFQGGPNGAVISEFSTHSCDEEDIFLDKNIKR